MSHLHDTNRTRSALLRTLLFTPLLLISVVGCGGKPVQPTTADVSTVENLNRVLRDARLCPTNFPHVDSPYVTFADQADVRASFGCAGKAVGADGFYTAEGRDRAASNTTQPYSAGTMVGMGNNLWILSASDDDGGEQIKRLLQGQWHPMENDEATGTDQQAGSSLVTYEVTGTGTVRSVTPSGISQVPSSSLPLEYSDFDAGAAVGLSIQNDEDFGSVSCTITAGDRVISTNTSSAGYGIAECSEIVP